MFGTTVERRVLEVTRGSYLTNGHELFRVERLLSEPEDVVLLENCRTLNLIVLPLDELADASLRLVRQAPG